MTQTGPLDVFAQRRHRAMNTLHTWLLVGGSLALLTVTAWAYGGPAAIVYAVIFGAVTFLIARNVSPKMVLSMYKARRVSPAEFPSGHRIVDELARRAGLPRPPALHVVPSQMMNAFAVGRRDDAAIAVTDALARRLTVRELAGVLAHEISHIAHEDIKVMALADMVSRYTSLMSTLGMLSLLFNVGGYAMGVGTAVPWLAVLVLIAAPTVGSLLQLALSRAREFDADLGAAMLTGDPDGLASALRKLEAMQNRAWEGLVLPGGRAPNPSVLRSHPRTEDRVARLMALKSAVADVEQITGTGPAEAAPPVRRRASVVPQIRRRQPDYGPWARHLAHFAGEPLAGGDDPDAPACDDSLNRPDGPPRLRVGRGGVWW